MNKNLIGWIAAAVLAVALGGVLIYEAASGDNGGSRKAALGTSSQGLPSNVSADFNQLQDQKDTPGTHELPDLGANQHPTQLTSNPPQRCNPNDEPNVFAEWRNNPENLGEAGGMADEIVVGTAMGTHKGTPFTVTVQGEPNNPQVTPTQDVTIHVTQSVKGPAQQGTNMTIERLGDAQGCFRVVGDPSYQQGQQYLLLLENGSGHHAPHVISPEGRYMVRANNTIQSENENDFGEDVDGHRLAQVISQLKAG